MAKTIVFSDMDGTFLDFRTKDYRKALPAVNVMKEGKVPLVFCSARIRREIDTYYRELGIVHPFISENGGAVFVPRGYFDFQIDDAVEKDGYEAIIFGAPYPELRKSLSELRDKTGFDIKGFGDITPEELAKRAGLPVEKARIAKQRDFTEPFFLDDGDIEIVKREIHAMGLTYTHGGKFHYIMGDNDKGRAVDVVTGLYKKAFGDIVTIGIGDGLNDQPMLSHVDRGFLVRNYQGKYSFSEQGITKVDNVGPAGFSEVVLSNVQ